MGFAAAAIHAATRPGGFREQSCAPSAMAGRCARRHRCRSLRHRRRECHHVINFQCPEDEKTQVHRIAAPAALAHYVGDLCRRLRQYLLA